MEKDKLSDDVVLEDKQNEYLTEEETTFVKRKLRLLLPLLVVSGAFMLLTMVLIAVNVQSGYPVITGFVGIGVGIYLLILLYDLYKFIKIAEKKSNSR